MMDNYIGNVLKKVRELKNIKQKDLGKNCNLPQSRIAQYETGNRIPKESQLEQLANVLDVDIQAFRNININMDNEESIRQLLFQLEEKGLFSIENITPNMTYIDGKPQWTLSLPVNDDTARFCRIWAELKKSPLPKDPLAYKALKGQTTENSLNNTNRQRELENWPKIDLEHWKYDKSDQYELDAHTENLDLRSTAQLAASDLLTPEEAINRLRKGYYSFDDLELIFQRLGTTTDYPSKQVEDEMYQLFLDQVIPEEYTYAFFEKKGEYGLPKIHKGYLKSLYDKAKSERSEK